MSHRGVDMEIEFKSDTGEVIGTAAAANRWMTGSVSRLPGTRSCG